MSGEKIYCGSGKIVNTQYGDMPKIKFHKDDINAMVKWMKENNSDFVNLDMKAKRDPAPEKPSHYLQLNPWKPDNQNNPNTFTGNPSPTNPEEIEDLPF